MGGGRRLPGGGETLTPAEAAPEGVPPSVSGVRVESPAMASSKRQRNSNNGSGRRRKPSARGVCAQRRPLRTGGETEGRRGRKPERGPGAAGGGSSFPFARLLRLHGQSSEISPGGEEQPRETGLQKVPPVGRLRAAFNPRRERGILPVGSGVCLRVNV